MLNRLYSLSRHLLLAFVLGLGLMFVTPAVEAHACTDGACAPAARQLSVSDADEGAACADCGPTCAGGCCHAPHPVTPPRAGCPQVNGAFASPDPLPLPALTPPFSPDGPDRPPRH